jgi:hypothetical protein
MRAVFLNQHQILPAEQMFNVGASLLAKEPEQYIQHSEKSPSNESTGLKKGRTAWHLLSERVSLQIKHTADPESPYALHENILFKTASA